MILSVLLLCLKLIATIAIISVSLIISLFIIGAVASVIYGMVHTFLE